jgi:hypothetical protein
MGAVSTGLKMEVAVCSETIVSIYQTTRHHIPEESILYSHRHENLNSCNYLFTVNFDFLAYFPYFEIME